VHPLQRLFDYGDKYRRQIWLAIGASILNKVFDLAPPALKRQRIAIARAVLKDPPILILDEATSAVDNETEAAIQRSLERITVNRTTIAIAHRLSTIRNADCIYVMEHGQLIESGTHEQLLEKNGIYTSLWRVQSGLK
jgi:ATP-binding cassette, subfamily B, bacterial